jgi:hypothetical protein
MGNVNSEVLDFMKSDLAKGLKQFGEYNFYDKGAYEVCEMAGQKLKTLSAADAAATLEAFSKLSEHSEKYVCDQICSLDDWGELFDMKAPWAKFIGDNY